MKRIVCLVLTVVLLISCTLSFTSCTDDDDCIICGGSGYYQKKDCPGC